ncbi:MAG: STAS domain-containing protein [Gallionella sp.]|nr:STAS domain-containing protein [Gallionella sp.]
MDISTSNIADRAIIRISGRFDSSKHRHFRDAYEPLLQQAGVGTLEIEISGVEHCNSASLGMLFLLRERALAAEKTVLLRNPSRKMAQLLELAHFNKLFAIL